MGSLKMISSQHGRVFGEKTIANTWSFGFGVTTAAIRYEALRLPYPAVPPSLADILQLPMAELALLSFIFHIGDEIDLNHASDVGEYAIGGQWGFEVVSHREPF